MLKVVNMRSSKESFVRVDRQTKWGNPFKMQLENKRDEVCDKFEVYAINKLNEDPKWLDELKGKNLGCWCAPKRCHAETLLRLANKPNVKEIHRVKNLLEQKDKLSDEEIGKLKALKWILGY